MHHRHTELGQSPGDGSDVVGIVRSNLEFDQPTDRCMNDLELLATVLGGEDAATAVV